MRLEKGKLIHEKYTSSFTYKGRLFIVDDFDDFWLATESQIIIKERGNTEVEAIDFIGEVPIDEFIDSKDKFNELLNDVFKRAVTLSSDVAGRSAHEKVLLSVPSLVLGHLNRQTVVNEMVTKFYDANKDLLVVKKTVGAVANTVHSENPDWDLPKVFEAAAVKTREILGMKKRVEVPNPVVDLEDPAFVKGSKGKTRRVTGTAIEDEIGELLT